MIIEGRNRRDASASRAAETLACTPDAVWLWPGIALTERRGGRIAPRKPGVIAGLVAKLHGPAAIHTPVVQAVERAAAWLNESDILRGRRALERASLPPVTPDGGLLVREVARRLDLTAPGIPIGSSPRLWSAADIHRFATLHAAQAQRSPELTEAFDLHSVAPTQRGVVKAGFNPGELRDWHGRWATEGGGGSEGNLEPLAFEPPSRQEAGRR